MIRLLSTLTILSLAYVALSTGACRADVPADVKKALQPTFDRLKQSKTSRVQVEQNVEIKINGNVQKKMQVGLEVVSATPNSYAIEATQEQAKSKPVVCDGKQLFSLVDPKAYLKQEAPANFNGMADSLLINFGPLDRILFPLVLAGGDPGPTLYEGIDSAEVADREKLGNRPATHVRLTDKEVTWDLWVSTDKSPEILRLDADLSRGVRQANPQLANQDLRYITTAIFSNWKLGGAVAKDAFVFTPPNEAIGYDSVEELQQAMQGPPPKLGEPAPDFQIVTLTGGKSTLAEHKGKNVVLLDFWATWCGPCRAGLPIVAGVAKELEAEGVVAYAVNLQETPDEIKAFLTEAKLDIPVALDIDGKIANQFEVSGIPHTVLIGKDGIVHAVHVGFSGEEAYRLSLTEELKSLLKGKSLLKEKKKN